jgi:hypothetical protein
MNNGGVGFRRNKVVGSGLSSYSKAGIQVNFSRGLLMSDNAISYVNTGIFVTPGVLQRGGSFAGNIIDKVNRGIKVEGPSVLTNNYISATDIGLESVTGGTSGVLSGNEIRSSGNTGTFACGAYAGSIAICSTSNWQWKVVGNSLFADNNKHIVDYADGTTMVNRDLQNSNQLNWGAVQYCENMWFPKMSMASGTSSTNVATSVPKYFMCPAELPIARIGSVSVDYLDGTCSDGASTIYGGQATHNTFSKDQGIIRGGSVEVAASGGVYLKVNCSTGLVREFPELSMDCCNY